ELEGLPRGTPTVLGIASDDFAPVVAMAAPLDDDSVAPAPASLIPLSSLELSKQWFGPRDMRQSPLVYVRVCQAPLTLIGNICVGLSGVRIALAAGPEHRPVYENALSLPDVHLTATVAQDVFFPSVRPGLQTITLSSASGDLHCAPQFGGIGWETSQ